MRRFCGACRLIISSSSSSSANGHYRSWPWAANKLMGLALIISTLVMAAANSNSAVETSNIHQDLQQQLQGWEYATATFYGDMDGNETMQGACGYGDLFEQCYGLETTALSTTMFNDGGTCGACFEIMCVHSKWCLPGEPVIQVTATNFCPPNYTKTVDIWCNPPRKHFDLTMPMFLKIAQYKAGVVPIAYRRVRCLPKQGGVRFQFKGNPYWLMVLVYNVGGDGQVVGVKIKGSNGSEWSPMSRNWGQNWQTWVDLKAQAISFQVTTSDGNMLQFDDVAPPNWTLGQTFEADNNFK